MLPNIKIKINGKRIYPSSSIKYLGIYLDEFLDGSAHCAQLQTKLQRANGMLAKTRHYLKNNPTQLLTIYHTMFSSHMLYGCQIWGQNDNNSLRKIQSLQNNALRLISFADSFYDHVSPIYKDLKLLKLRDLITLKNIIFIHEYFNDKLPNSFAGYFNLTKNMHPHNLRTANHGQIFMPTKDTVRYGRKSITIKSIQSWNDIAKKFPQENLLKLSLKKLKSIVVKYFIESYT